MTRQEKRRRENEKRNRLVLARYKELKQSMKWKEAIDQVADEFNLGFGTVKKILYEPDYSSSPLNAA